jgi:hypothetical protein
MILLQRHSLSSGTSTVDVRELLGKLPDASRKRKRLDGAPPADLRASTVAPALRDDVNVTAEDANDERVELLLSEEESGEDLSSEDEMISDDTDPERSTLRRERARQYDLEDTFIDDSELANPMIGFGGAAKQQNTARSGFFVNQGVIEMASPPRGGFIGLTVDRDAPESAGGAKSDRARAAEEKRKEYLKKHASDGKWLREQSRELKDKLAELRICAGAIRSSTKGTDKDVLDDSNLCVYRELCRLRSRGPGVALTPRAPPRSTRSLRLLQELDVLARNALGHRKGGYLAQVMLLFRAVGTAKLTRVLKELEQRSTVDALKRELDAAKVAFGAWVKARLAEHPLAPVTTEERALAVVAQSGAKRAKAPPPPGTKWPGWGDEAGMEGKSQLMNLVDVTAKYVDASNDLPEYKKPNEKSNRVERRQLYEHLSKRWADGAMTVKALQRKQKDGMQRRYKKEKAAKKKADEDKAKKDLAERLAAVSGGGAGAAGSSAGPAAGAPPAAPAAAPAALVGGPSTSAEAVPPRADSSSGAAPRMGDTYAPLVFNEADFARAL